MKIVLTGGGTGGHFYPLIAVAESLRIIASEDHISDLDLFYYSDKPYDDLSMRNQRIHFEQIPSGKLGLSYSVWQKFRSLLQVGYGVLVALWKLFLLYPDAVLAKGGYASVPTSLAAWILRIPLIIHESDAAPGRANVFLSRFAYIVCVSYASAASYFPGKRVIHTGQPIRRALLHPSREGAHELFQLENALPVVWVNGGSLGAQAINMAVLNLAEQGLYHFQIVHQTGANNIAEIQGIAHDMLADHPHADRYHPIAYLDELSMRRIAGIANIVITRAGGSLFEIASWQIPSIIIPRPVSNADHNRKNAYAYAAYGGGVVMEEANLTPQLLLTEILRILQDPATVSAMQQGAVGFATPHAADMIAEELVKIGYEHEPKEVKSETPISVLIEQQLEQQDQKKTESDTAK